MATGSQTAVLPVPLLSSSPKGWNFLTHYGKCRNGGAAPPFDGEVLTPWELYELSGSKFTKKARPSGRAFANTYSYIYTHVTDVATGEVLGVGLFWSQ